MQTQSSDGEFAAALGEDVLAAAQLDQVAATRQACQRCLQIGASGAFGAEFAHELLEIGPGVREASNVFEQRAIRHILILVATLATLEASDIALERLGAGWGTYGSPARQVETGRVWEAARNFG